MNLKKRHLFGPTSFPNKGLAIGVFLLRLFFILFCYSFTIILGSVVFANNDSGLLSAILLLLIAINLVLMFFIYRSITKHFLFVERNYKYILAFGLLFLFAANVVFGYVLRYEPIFDLGAIFTGAAEWSSTGSFMQAMNWTCDPDYFYYFPNNLGGMSLLFFAFKVASWFGATDYFAIAMITNAVLTTATVLLTALVCKRLFGIKQSVMALICVLMSPPFYFMAPVFYTDSLSMIFPILVLYLYLKYADCKTAPQRIIFLLSIGLCCAIGMLIKFTVIIVLLAIIIYHLLTKGLLRVLPIAAFSGIIIATVFMIFNTYFYSIHLDKSIAEKLNVPYSHWIMMSLEGDGRYNPQDYEFTFSFDDPNERKAAISNRIKERVESRGFPGMLSLFYGKGIVAFGDGTYAQSDFLDDTPANDTVLHSFVLYDGEYFPEYKYICSGTYFALQLLTLIAAYLSLWKRNEPDGKTIPLLCIFGIMLFLMIWEVSGRYATNYIPFIIVSAVSGLSLLAPRTSDPTNVLYKGYLVLNNFDTTDEQK